MLIVHLRALSIINSAYQNSYAFQNRVINRVNITEGNILQHADFFSKLIFCFCWLLGACPHRLVRTCPYAVQLFRSCRQLYYCRIITIAQIFINYIHYTHNYGP